MNAGITAEVESELVCRVVYTICERSRDFDVSARAAFAQRAIRDTEIYCGWGVKGFMAADKVSRYSLYSEIYAIIARQRALQRRSEPDLFGFDDGTTSPAGVHANLLNEAAATGVSLLMTCDSKLKTI